MTSDCMAWEGRFYADGYGRRAGTTAHRSLFIEAYGPLPVGYEVDHLCNNRACVNPDHLEAVSRDENIRRAVERRTTCRRGHDRERYGRLRADGKLHCNACARGEK